MIEKEIYRDKCALENLGLRLEQLNLTEEQENYFALGFKAGIEYARKNPKITFINKTDENPLPSVYGC